MPRSNGIRVSFPNILLDNINHPRPPYLKKIMAVKLSYMIQQNSIMSKWREKNNDVNAKDSDWYFPT
jgi:hypothetical protein